MKLLKRTPRLISALAATFLLAVLLLPVVPRAFTPKATAAGDWFRSDGSKFSGDAKTYFDNNFEFLNTQTIVDKITNQKYLTASVPAYDLSITDAVRIFMYWPVSDSGTILANKSPCLGGFQASVGKTDNRGLFGQVVIDFVPTVSGSGGACTVNNHQLSFYSGNITDTVKNGALPSVGSFVDKKDNIAQKIASVFSWWNNSALVTAGYNEVLPEIINSPKLNLPGALDKIRADLSKKSGDAEVRALGDLSQVRYFSTRGCYDSAKGGYKAFVAIKPGATGYGYMFHYNEGDASQYIQNNWHGKQQSCLTGGRDYQYNPGWHTGVSDTSGQSKIWLGDESLSSRAPTPEQLAIMNDGGFAGGASGAAGGTDLDCENNAGVLGWLICPVVRAINGAANWLDKTINEQLTVNINQYFGDTESGKGVYQAWSTFRTLALSLLVIIALVMVIGQAMNFGPFDAYTVKKVLPRILAAVILIALSWELGRFLVQFSNDLGAGVQDMFYRILPSGMQRVNIGGVSGSLTYLAAGGAVIALGIVGVLSLGLTAILALFIGFLIIIFRQLIIVLCVVTAPIALVAFILPNTQKVWKFWKDAFQGALLVFPLITGFIAAGHVMAAFQNSINPTDVFNNVVTLILYIGPYFLLPLVFKLVGGIMSTLGGMVNDRGRGMFDRLKGFRKNRAAQNWTRMRNYGRFSDRNALTRGFNAVLGAGSHPIRDLRRGRAGVRSGRQAGRILQGAINLENDDIWKANQNDDNFLVALADRDLAQQRIDEARANGNEREAQARERAMTLAGQVRSRDSAGTRLTALNKLAQTGFQFSAGERGVAELAQTVRSITRGDNAAFGLAMNEAQFHLKNAGRSDMAGINYGSGPNIKAGARRLSSAQRGQGKTDTYHGMAAAWLGNSVINESGETAGTAERMALDLANSDASDADIAEYHSMLLNDRIYATDANKLEIDKQLQAIRIHAAGGPEHGPPAPGTEGPTLSDRLDRNERALRAVSQDDPRIVGPE